MSLRGEIVYAEVRPELTIVQFSLFYFLLAKKGLLTQEDQDEFTLQVMRTSIAPGMLEVKTEYQAGVLDYVAVTAAACVVDYAIALGLLQYGQNTKVEIDPFLRLKYFYNNLEPGKAFDSVETPGNKPRINWKAWLGRYPSIIAHFEFAAWKRPPLWRKIFWAAHLILASYGTEKHQERNLIAWLMVQTALGKSRICDFAIRIWQKKFQSQYPQGIQYLVSNIFESSHPLAKYWSS